ncbi:hypothetical protein LG634_01095 [Streptomyces bambusae]|uniref:hypothetical protein n=1 Tax=Streptomyces bambusae TaxID=1550616 RepID=UPI001CFE2A2F|nr:hypothetical protein [Streptomyces bambusae]MCB5163449.1 hypothetical protein [Streptomyces bambusae]
MTEAAGGGVVGRTGRVSGSIGPGLVGEVLVPVRGGSEAFLAYAAVAGERFGPGALVTVVEYMPPRTVYVAAAYGV